LCGWENEHKQSAVIEADYNNNSDVMYSMRAPSPDNKNS